MGRSSRDKGKRRELQAVAMISEFGGDAERDWGAVGSRPGDIDSAFGRAEVKARATFPNYIAVPEGCRFTLLKADGKPWLVLMRGNDAMRLMHMEREIALRAGGEGE